jgi:hypothetical protein
MNLTKFEVTIKTVALWMALILLFQGLVFAQGRMGSLSGTVRDESGAVIPGLTIIIRNVDIGLVRTLITDEEGRYRAPMLELGIYEVTAEMTGFKRFTRQGIRLTLDRETIVDVTLLIGAIAESVTIVEEVPLVDTVSSSLSSLVEEQKIQDLPLNGRDYVLLATLQSGIHTARAQSTGTNTGQGTQISISGSRPVQNNFRLDGTSVTDYTGSTPGSINGINLGVDAIREFSVLSSTYSAQYGRSAGGVINAVTRSGTNEFHGTLFYFHRNDNLDARNFFDGEEIPEFRRHQFGASAGGPIHGNRTFFFANYEALCQLRGNTSISTTLSDEARQGRLQSGTVIIDPKVEQVLALYPRANGDVLGDTGLFIFPNNVNADEDYLTIRIDHKLWRLGNLFARYTFDDSDRSSLDAFAINRVADGTRNQSVTLDWTTSLSSNALNSVRFGFIRFRNVNRLAEAIVAEADNAELSFIPGQKGLGIIQVPGLSDFPGGSGGVDADINAFNSFQIYDDLTWSRGAHWIRVGGALERTHFNENSQSQANGVYQFRTIQDFVTNRPNQFSAQFPGSDTIRGWRQWIAAWYVQDDWKAAPGLTLNLGLRHEWATVPVEVNGKIANLDELTSPEMRVGDPLYDNPSLRSFAPRIGFAWDPFGKGKTSVRGGYGIFYDQLLSQFVINAGVRNPPFFLRGSISSLSPGDFPSLGFEKLVDKGTAALRAERIPRDLNQPYVQQWNLNIQQDIGFNSVVTAGYVGSHGVNLSAIVEDANLVIPTVLSDGRLFFPADGKKLNQNFSMIRDRLFDGHSFYHGLQLGVQRRGSHGIQYQLSYTFAKCIDDDSSTFSHDEAANAIGIPVNGNHKFNRGLSTFDVRHNIVLNVTWDMPALKHRSRISFLAGWQLGIVASHTSGVPFSPTLAYDAAQTRTSRPNRQGGQRPDLAPGRSSNPVTGDPRQWFDLTAFIRPEPGFLGNLGRNTVIGPDFTNVDFSLIKRIPIGRLDSDARLDFRVEFFNLLNHPNFDLPAPSRMEIFTANGVREDAGRITSASASREIQFGLKLYY